MKTFFKVLIAIVSVLYPILVFTLLVVFNCPVRVVSLFVVFMALIIFLSATGTSKQTDKTKRKITFSIKPLVSSVFLFALGSLCYLTDSSLFLKIYPVIICVTMLFVFGITLFQKPNIIFRFATLQDKKIKESVNSSRIEKYCFKVTVVWCIWFVINSLVAGYTIFYCSDKIWSIYNGGISYVIMGLIFIIEFIVRYFVNKNMPEYYSITEFQADSRKDDHIVCYEDKWSCGKYKTWKDFLTDTAKIRGIIESYENPSWILHCNDYWYFLCTFVALLQCRKEVKLTANVSLEFIKEMRQAQDGFLTDIADYPDSVCIQKALEASPVPSEEQIRITPKIDRDQTKIYMFTSGSTGKPKAVLQRMTEFELDNAFIFSKWGEDFCKRKNVSTLSQHHIYGFLFTVTLPFAAGVPIRRTRIEFPAEFNKLDDAEYMIIAVPAFLKRTVESEEKLPLKNCFIFTSGGVLLPEVASKTDEVFGFWPVEVYGSTETSGIAYRQSKNGLEWTPFDNAKIWLNEGGCLVIKSPYIKNPEGFVTGDLVDIYPDGRFVMKGRADSIVKIEEKRVSLTEVENRLLQSGLVKDVCVVAMSDRRQYLAGALVFNEEGVKKFEGMKKFDINMYFHNYLLNFFENVVIPKKWRYLDNLPVDLQGKKKKLEIQALFTKIEE